MPDTRGSIDLQGLIAAHREEIRRAWIQRVRSSPGRYRERSRDELSTWVSQSLRAVSESLETGSPDPVVAQPGGGEFELPGEPARRRIAPLESFVTMRGGAYLFMPGLAGLKWLAGRDGARG